jgi:type I restriction enzyme M protein
VKHHGLDNHGMGTVFEELARRFNEENNEETGEHWTARDAVKLMARLVFLPITNEIESGTYLLYNETISTGGMLTVAEETLQELAAAHGKQVATHLYGQEIGHFFWTSMISSACLRLLVSFSLSRSSSSIRRARGSGL